MAVEVHALLKRLEELEHDNEHLRSDNEHLRSELERVLRELEEWKKGYRRRGRQRRKNKGKSQAGSSSTNTGSGSDGEENEKRGPGRSKGHPGSGRPGPKRIDKTVECRSPACDCGGEPEDVGIGRTHTVEELVITVVATQYQCLKQRCTCCGREWEAPLPPELGGAPKVGPNAQAVAMALRYDHGLTVGNVSRVFSGLFELPFSPGGLSMMFERNLTKCAPAINEIWAKIDEQDLVLVDETGWRVDGQTAWLWGVSNDELSVFLVSDHRDRETFRALVPSDYSGFVVTDGYVVYDHLDEKKHPQCWGHVLRTPRDLADIHGDPRDAAMRDRVHDFIDAAKKHRAGEMTSETRKPAVAAFEQVIQAGAEAAHTKLQTLASRLDRQRVRYLLCLDDPAIPLTTNRIEGDLRPPIIARKLSFGTRNDTGSILWGDGLTLGQTLKKQGSSIRRYIPHALASTTRGGPPPSVFG